MNINTNLSALRISGLFRQNSLALSNTYSQLSSGKRINSARDDAAGLQISTRITSQINGMNVAIRNANDGISMLQVAEGSMQQVTNNLQRMRDIALQAANATNTVVDRQALNEEYLQLEAEINRINEATTFGGQRLYETNSTAVPDNVVERELARGMQTTWLYESEQIILDELGIEGKGTMKIDFEYHDGAGGTAAFVQYAVTGSEATNIRMVVDLDDYGTVDGIHDQSGTALNEVILHEMVHAVQAVNFEDWDNMPAWFKEGSAEVIRGADSRLSADIAANGFGGGTGVDDLFFAEAGSTAVVSTAGAYSGGYVALRYMAYTFGEKGMKNFMQDLADGSTFAAALNTASNGNWANEAAFMAELSGAAIDTVTYPTQTRFQEFVETQMDLTNADNGALGGEDAAGGISRSNTMSGAGGGGKSGSKGFEEQLVLNDNDNDGTDFTSTTNYNLASRGDIYLQDYESVSSGSGGRLHTFQVGANPHDTIQTNFGALSSSTLGLDDVNIVERAQFAIFAIDDALKIVDTHRSQLGAVQNRLQSTVNNLSNVVENQSAARSRILDTDFAAKTAELTRYQIIQQVSVSLLSQANQSQQLALRLLNN